MFSQYVDHPSVAVELKVARLVAYPLTWMLSVAHKHNQMYVFHPKAIEIIRKSCILITLS